MDDCLPPKEVACYVALKEKQLCIVEQVDQKRHTWKIPLCEFIVGHTVLDSGDGHALTLRGTMLVINFDPWQYTRSDDSPQLCAEMLSCARQDEAELAKFSCGALGWCEVRAVDTASRQGRLTAEVYRSALSSDVMRLCHQHLCATEIVQCFADAQPSQSPFAWWQQALSACALGACAVFVAGSVVAATAVGTAAADAGTAADAAAAAAAVAAAAGSALAGPANGASRAAAVAAGTAAAAASSGGALAQRNVLPAPDEDDESNFEPVSVSFDYICEDESSSIEKPSLLVMLKYDGDMLTMSDDEVAHFSARVKKTVIKHICSSQLNHSSLNAHPSSRILTDCCPICLEAFEVGEAVALCDRGHAFHESCLAKCENDLVRTTCCVCRSGPVGQSFRHMAPAQSSSLCAPKIPQELQSCTPTLSEKEWESCIQVAYCGQGSVVVGFLVAGAVAVAAGGLLYYLYPRQHESPSQISQQQRDEARMAS